MDCVALGAGSHELPGAPVAQRGVPAGLGGAWSGGEVREAVARAARGAFLRHGAVAWHSAVVSGAPLNQGVLCPG